MASARQLLKPVDSTVAEKLEGILRNLLSRRAAAAFRTPVDWQRLKLHHYPEIVKQPMDLGTIVEYLRGDATRPYERKRYQFIEEFAHDVRLVWKNAFLFNPPNHEVFKHAKILSEAFEDKLTALHAELDRDAPPCSLVDRCQILLSDCFCNPLSEFFRKDDWRQIGGYVAAIKSGRPTDLDDVQRWLDKVPADSGEKIVDQFAERVRLVYQNAIDFNGPAAPFGTMARILYDVFDKRLKLLRAAPRPPPPRQRLPDREGWPTFEQKQVLFSECSELPLREARLVADTLQKSCPAAIKTIGDANASNAIVDFDLIDLATFAQLEAMVARWKAQPAQF
mmetsp:Transcript_3093/g.6420  ORF Transcript_3093/g.6420 Transcript_3093/m.6420 type:complete len:337 (+) Transcript_3093:474-1484(+)